MDRIGDLSQLKLTKRRQEILNGMGIYTIRDLLHHYPAGYENVEATPASSWKKGDHVAFEGMVISEPVVRWLGKKRSMMTFDILVEDQPYKAVIFNMPWKNNLALGKPMSFFGIYQGNQKVTITRYNGNPLKAQTGLIPRYTIPKSLKPKEMQAIMEKALEKAGQMEEVVPERYRQKYKLLSKKQALEQIHKPAGPKALKAAIRTLKYEEFLKFQCVLQSTQIQLAQKEPKIFDQSLIDEQIAKLPYTLTPDQQSVLEEILRDLRSDRVMYRMVQGDVGCGKTVVAALSLYASVLSGYQAALLAPTEILARQHFAQLEKMGFAPTLLVGSLNAKQKKEALERIESGKAGIIVGTHAIFQENVTFDHLGLIVADEQHRFGVRQRRSLIQKGSNPDFLMMSATPIPRTYAHFLFGDIALSAIHTLPPGRKPVITRFINKATLKPVLKELLEGISQGKQAYVICAVIEENEEFPMQAAEKIYEGMKRTFKDSVSIGLLHGRMNNEQKQQVMEDFLNKKIDILVSTTVVEVGVDVPNATMMAIYDAHRFGLSTLHQLRGRVARGKNQGVCWLLSSSKDEQAQARLKKMEELSDGFSLSRFDLETRGPGDLLGTRQSGLPGFLLGDFQNDPGIMEACLNDAREILEAHSDVEMLRYIKEAAGNAAYMD